jgi:hypothetical protein
LKVLDDDERLGSRQLGREFVKQVMTTVTNSRMQNSNSSDGLLPVSAALLPTGLRSLGTSQLLFATPERMDSSVGRPIRQHGEIRETKVEANDGAIVGRWPSEGVADGQSHEPASRALTNRRGDQMNTRRRQISVLLEPNPADPR